MLYENPKLKNMKDPQQRLKVLSSDLFQVNKSDITNCLVACRACIAIRIYSLNLSSLRHCHTTTLWFVTFCHGFSIEIVLRVTVTRNAISTELTAPLIGFGNLLFLRSFTTESPVA